MATQLSGVLNSRQAVKGALALQQKGEALEARKRYRQILQHEPDNANAMHLCGRTYLETGKEDTAIAMIKSVIDLTPKQPIFHFNLGVASRHAYSATFFLTIMMIIEACGQPFATYLSTR